MTASGFVRANPEEDSTINQNLILAASPSPLVSPDFLPLPTNGFLLTDDLNPIDILLERARTRFYFRR
jgi:hypothetical protein